MLSIPLFLYSRQRLPPKGRYHFRGFLIQQANAHVHLVGRVLNTVQTQNSPQNGAFLHSFPLTGAYLWALHPTPPPP